MSTESNADNEHDRGPFAALARFVIGQKLVVFVLTALALFAGVAVAPFDWDVSIPRDPVPVDAIPDIGENQQIVFADWMGRSPQDIEDQVTYPLSVALLGVPDVRTVRGISMFGFSVVYVVFEEEAGFYEARARILERLASLPDNQLPEGVTPRLGPDATALGQIFWYTVEGRDSNGRAVGGWDPHELRTLQDYRIRYALAAADGVAEVASIGGFVREVQVEVDPNRLRAHGVTLNQVLDAVRMSNLDVGGQTTEINGVEYVIRGVGLVEELGDIEQAVVVSRDNTPITVRDVATVSFGPAYRDGALDRGGAEVVGGVVVARHGANPMQVIENVRAAMQEVQQSLPSRVLPDGTVSQVTIVPFYDRTGLIRATLGTLNDSIWQEILITVLVVLVLLVHLRSSILISLLLPVAVLLTFVAMKWAGVDANVVSLAGIAIAIGTMVDIGIVVTENIVQHVEKAGPRADLGLVIRRAVSEVSGAVVAAVATTVLSFVPVFFLEGPEGRLFEPLAFTKTIALSASLLVGLTLIPPIAHVMFGTRVELRPRLRVLFDFAVVLLGGIVAFRLDPIVGGLLMALGAARRVDAWVQSRAANPGVHRRLTAVRVVELATNVIAVAVIAVLLAENWAPLGAAAEQRNLVFVVVVVGGLLLFFRLLAAVYRDLLRWVLDHKLVFAIVPLAVVVTGATVWLGFTTVFRWAPESWHRSDFGVWGHHTFPGLGREFMPQLDEGAFLYMPSAMPHASLGETLDMVSQLDRLIETVPEVDFAVGKLGRADSALDPAPVQMIETLIQYVPEYRLDENGRRIRYRVDADGNHVRDAESNLIVDADGLPYRNWRPEIRTEQDIWAEVVRVAEVPGLTSAPLLQPISTRIVMLQSGIRAPMAVRLRGPDLMALAEASTSIERILREHPLVAAEAVNADRPVGKPYLEIIPNREAIARFGLSMMDVHEAIEVAIGGMRVTQTIDGRERTVVRVRYPRELRDSPEAIEDVLVATMGDTMVPLGELAEVRYRSGPQMIRSEDTALVNYVMFDRAPGLAEVAVVDSVRAALDAAIADGSLILPDGVSYAFVGSYENALRAEQRLKVLVPIVLLCIFLILYMQFRSVLTTSLVFSGIAVSLSGGMIFIWLAPQTWFMDFEFLGANMREVFQLGTVNLSVAVWVGFIALFGIATDDGVVMATYLDQEFSRSSPTTRDEVRARVIDAGARRIRPCLMTTATTILALLPIFTSYGTGAEIMYPMALPAIGGMSIEIISLFILPALYCAVEERRAARRARNSAHTLPTEGPAPSNIPATPTRNEVP